MKRSSHHILLVDDDLGRQFLTQHALRKTLSDRSTVHLANSGHEAIAYMMGEGEFSDRARHPFPTIVITDLNMPDGDGFDVLDFMRHNPEWNVVPRIMPWTIRGWECMCWRSGRGKAVCLHPGQIRVPVAASVKDFETWTARQTREGIGGGSCAASV
jgi:CheY-like chemotaxis protein